MNTIPHPDQVPSPLPKKKKRAQKPESFRDLVDEQANRVAETLQLFGGFPGCTEDIAREVDWMHALMTRMTDAMEQARFDLCDPVVSMTLRRHLAQIVATCEAWDKQLTIDS